MSVRENKRETIIENAVSLFAENGYYKTTTAMIANAAGVTQPYVFHFFENKEGLFKAVIDRAFNRVYNAFLNVEGPPDELIETMGRAFAEIVRAHRDEVLMVMQAHAISEASIREHVRNLFLTMFESLTVKFQKAGIPKAKETTSYFISQGLLITVAEVLNLPELNCGPV